MIAESGHDSNTNSKLFSRNDIKGGQDDHVHYLIVLKGFYFKVSGDYFTKKKKNIIIVRTTKLANTWFESGIREGGAKNQHSPFVGMNKIK
jgi:hypothetical protein